jgi:hypothetical protein
MPFVPGFKVHNDGTLLFVSGATAVRLIAFGVSDPNRARSASIPFRINQQDGVLGRLTSGREAARTTRPRLDRCVQWIPLLRGERESRGEHRAEPYAR